MACTLRTSIWLGLRVDGYAKFGSIKHLLKVEDELKEQVYDDTNKPPRSPRVARINCQPPTAAPMAIHNSRGIKLPPPLKDIPGVFHLDGKVLPRYTLDFYADCPAPHCVEGWVELRNLEVELVIDPFGVLPSVKVGRDTIGPQELERVYFGACLEPDWQPCCETVMRHTVPFEDEIPIVPDLAYIKATGAVEVVYQINNKPVKDGPGQQKPRQAVPPKGKRQTR